MIPSNQPPITAPQVPPSYESSQSGEAVIVQHEAEVIIAQLREKNWTEARIKRLGDYIVQKYRGEPGTLSYTAFNKVMAYFAEHFKIEEASLLVAYGHITLSELLSPPTQIRLAQRLTVEEAMFLGKSMHMKNYELYNISYNHSGSTMKNDAILGALKSRKYDWTLEKFINTLKPPTV